MPVIHLLDSPDADECLAGLILAESVDVETDHGLWAGTRDACGAIIEPQRAAAVTESAPALA
jgi:hypothetical protein